MGLLSGFDVATSGIIASRAALDLKTQNLVNQQMGGYKGKIPILQAEDDVSFEDEFNAIDVRNSTKEPHVRLRSRFSSQPEDTKFDGVKLGKVIEDQTPVDRVYDPTNPLADEEGYAEGSNINTTKEMVDIIELKKLFEMSAMAFNMEKSTLNTSLKIGEK